MRYAIGPEGYCQSVLLSCGTESLNSPEAQRVLGAPPQRCLRKGGIFPCRDSYRGDWHRPAILSSVRWVACSCGARPLEKNQIATVSPAPWQPRTLSSESCMSNNCSRSRVIEHTTLIRFVTPPYPQSVRGRKLCMQRIDRQAGRGRDISAPGPPPQSWSRNEGIIRKMSAKTESKMLGVQTIRVRPGPLRRSQSIVPW